MPRPTKPYCTLPQGGSACAAHTGCETCGWEEAERARRKALPLVRDEDGLRRKHVGISNKPGRT